jgi:hypothetical protein
MCFSVPCAGAAPPPNPPPRPASGSYRLPNTLGQVGEQYGPSIAPFAHARCPFLPLTIFKAILYPYPPGGAARGSHTGQFSCFGPRSCFIAFVLGIPNGFRPLNRAVGRAYIRKTDSAYSQRVALWLVGCGIHPRSQRVPPCGPRVG